MSKNSQTFDLAIIGTGPAGYSAAIYAARYQIKTVILGMIPGGTITKAHRVCNYPGFPEISGIELGQKMQQHAQSLGVTEIPEIVETITISKDKSFKITTAADSLFTAKAIILATGTHHRELGLAREQEFLGKGITYCATCDAAFFKDKVVAVAGGSDAANTAALLLADLAKQVYIIYRRDKLRGDQIWIKQVIKQPKISVIYNTNIIKLGGKEILQNITLDQPYQGQKTLKVDGLFVEIGSEPEATLAKQLKLAVDPGNFIKVKPDQSTNVPGVYAAGDITTNSNQLKQVITAVSEGAVAANAVFEYIH